MTTSDRQQSLAAARRACEWLSVRLEDMLEWTRRDIEALIAEFTRLDKKERKQKKTGAKGAIHGKKGGRPPKTRKANKP